MGQIPSTSAPRVGVDSGYGTAAQVANQNRDQDHRLHPSGYENSHAEENSAERAGIYDSRRGLATNWMPQIRVAVDPHQVKRLFYICQLYLCSWKI